GTSAEELLEEAAQLLNTLPLGRAGFQPAPRHPSPKRQRRDGPGAGASGLDGPGAGASGLDGPGAGASGLDGPGAGASGLDGPGAGASGLDGVAGKNACPTRPPG